MTEQEFFTYKGLPLVRKDNTIYYGNMSDKYVAMLTVLSTHKVKDLEIADKTRVQLMSTDPKTPATEIIAKTAVFFTAERFYAVSGFNDAYKNR